MKVQYFSEFFTYFFNVLPINARGLRKISVRANVPAYNMYKCCKNKEKCSC